MKILAIDTSSQSASCAIANNGVLLGEFFTNVKLTHSQTIMPMVDNLLAQTRVKLSDIDAFAVTNGPGSFTGLRIGLSAVKGMAHALGKDCIAVPTLEALAYAFYGTSYTVAPVLDARCSQVYTSLVRWNGERPEQLAEDDAIPIATLETRLKKVESSVFLVGDGAEMCYNSLKECVPDLRLASPALRYTRASAVALAAEKRAAQGLVTAADALVPAYLRLPQAERELLARKNLR